MKESNIFSRLDINSGYNQVEMDPESRKYTDFRIKNKNFECKRMPFGLKNSPKTLQRIMDKIFDRVDFVKVYLDDIIIHSDSFEQHNEHLETILKIINDNNM
ncbi:Polyprotein P3 [Dictyocoela muelleri]|nr:Polyprotein P3 [Dictyocoela muelleri]